MNQPDPVKVMAGAILGLCLIGAAGTMVGVRRADKAKSEAMASRSAPSPSFFIDYHDRPWVLHDGVGYFDFSKEEWRMITGAWPTKGETVTMPQGPIRMADKETIDKLATKWPGSLRTNRCWFNR